MLKDGGGGRGRGRDRDRDRGRVPRFQWNGSLPHKLQHGGDEANDLILARTAYKCSVGWCMFSPCKQLSVSRVTGV